MWPDPSISLLVSTVMLILYVLLFGYLSRFL